jgi:hypothetical protein
MGTTLTGTTPQDTYDSLIKVTDNGPLSGTAKYLSDGLGNDSALALSTAFVGSGTTAISNWQLFKGFQTIGGNAFVGYEDQSEIWSNSFYDGAFKYFANGFATRFACINGEYDFNTAPENTSGAGAAATFTNRLKITNGGNVGIGTSSPDIFGRFYTRSVGIDSNGISKIQINGTTYSGIDLGSGGTRRAEINADAAGVDIATIGSIPLRLYTNGVNRISVTDNGLTFNGDTAAANALDDYEEGTWTMGVAFGGASVGVTYDINTGSYTKIGRQVTVNGFLILTSKGISVGDARITGLPFVIGTASQFHSAASLRLENISFADFPQAVGAVAQSIINLEEVTNAGVRTSITASDFTDTSAIIISLTYFTA